MRLALILTILLAIPVICAGQTTWYVDDDAPGDPGPGDPSVSDPSENGTVDHPFDTIQEGINSAATQDTVLVLQGTYVENVVYQNKGIVLQSADGPHVTVIDGDQIDTVVTMDNYSWLCPYSVLDGFTITNGLSSTIKNRGGGVNNEAGGVIRNCIIQGNRTRTKTAQPGGPGGGIFTGAYDQYLFIINCIISDNVTGDGETGFSGGSGGGIAGSRIVVEKCTIVGNRTGAGGDGKYGSGFGGDGGGICGNGEIKDCVIQNNICGGGGSLELHASPGSSAGDGGSGGGICGEYLLIKRCYISGNRTGTGGNSLKYNCNAGDGGCGGGVCCGVAITLDSCTVAGNQAGSGGSNLGGGSSGENGKGGGLSFGSFSGDSQWALILNNLFDGNISPGGGGGIICCHATDMFCITNNTIVRNSSTYSEGGGIYIFGYWSPATPEITNNILWENTAMTFNEIFEDNANAVVTFCDVQGGWPGTGNIDTMPLFVDPDGPDDDLATWEDNDYHLSALSPCVGVGDNSVITEPYDIEGDPRIAYGTVDMGADEFYPHFYYTGDATPSGNIELKFIGLPGNLINGLLIGVDIFDPPLPCDYGLWYMKNPFLLMTGLGTIPADGVLVVPGAIPANQPAPLAVYLQAAIDSMLTNLCPVNVE